MAVEPLRQRRRQEADDDLLQLVPLLPADFSQPLRRARLDPDHQPHDPWRRLPADQHVRPGPPAGGRRGAAGEMARHRARAGVEGPAVRHLAAAAGAPDAGRHHRIRIAAARACHPRRDRRFEGQRLVQPASQFLYRPARSEDRGGQGISRPASGRGRVARHALDLRRHGRHRVGLGELGAQHLAS